MTSEECRAHSRECEEQAKTVRDTGVKADLLSLAQQWQELADQKQRRQAQRRRFL